MGIDTSNFQPVVSTTLGTNGVHPLEMAQAYSVIAADGVLHPARVRLEDRRPDRQGDLPATTARARGCSTPQVARTETQMLTEVLKNGTAAGPQHRPARGGQDRHHRPQPGRLVHRLHAADHDRGVDGRPERRDPDDQRRRHLRVRRDVSRAHLGRVHEGRARATCRPLDFIAARREPVAAGRSRSTSRAAASTRTSTRRSPTQPRRRDRAAVTTPAATVPRRDHARPRRLRCRRHDAAADARRRPPPATTASHHDRRRDPDMSAEELEALLLVQEHDTARDRLRHRRGALPERAELEARSRAAARPGGARRARCAAAATSCSPTSAASTTKPDRSASRADEVEQAALLGLARTRRASSRRCRPTSTCCSVSAPTSKTRSSR